MIYTLTTQMRSIGAVAKAITLGDLDTTMDIEAQGEWLEVKTIVNLMGEHLRTLDERSEFGSVRNG
jgi:hypothetical protein